nr:MAG TPA: hypothetical protein [Caudoviricetes sp.]
MISSQENRAFTNKPNNNISNISCKKRNRFALFISSFHSLLNSDVLRVDNAFKYENIDHIIPS